MNGRFIALVTVWSCVCILTAFPASAVFNCDTTQTITTNQTLSDDFVRTTQGIDPCIKVSGAGVVVNMGGHKLLCQSTTGVCGPAVSIDSTGTIRNGEIDASTGTNGPAEWDTGIECLVLGGGGAYTDCSVSNMIIHTTGEGIAGGKSIDTTVIEDADTCIDSGKAETSGASISQVFCDASSVGFSLTGPSGGSFSVQKNFVRVSSGTGVDLLGGVATLTHNIIDASTPISGSPTLSENICSDAMSCPDPTASGFSLSLDFN